MVYPLFFHCINSVFKQWFLHWSGCLLLAILEIILQSLYNLMNVLHFSCLLSYLKACKNMLLHETLCSNAHSLLRYVRVELCRRFLPLALCSNVLLVFLPKPSAILPHTVLTVLFGLSCELYFSTAISLFPFQLCAPSGAGSSVTQSSHHAEDLRGF